MNWFGSDPRNRALLALAFSILLVPSFARAESESEREEIVVTGNLLPRSAALMPVSTSVFDGKSIEASQAQGLTGFLRFVPGLHVSQSGARGGRASLSLRGLDPNHVLVLVDGVRLNDPTSIQGGAVDPTTLALLDIDRIEVVRGPLSAVYGSDALAGAINVITRRTGADEQPSFSLAGGGGRFETGTVRGRASAGLGFAGVSLAGSYDTNGDPFSAGGYSGGNLKASLDSTLPGNVDVRATLRFSDSLSTAFPEASGGPDLAVFRELEERDAQEVSAGFQLQRAAADWLDLALELHHSQRWEELGSPGIFSPDPDPTLARPRTESSDEWGRTQLSGSSRIRPIEPLEITLGGDLYWESGDVDATYFFGPGPGLPSAFALDRRVGGVFAEALYRFDPVAINLSVRGDFPDEAATEWSPAVGAVIELPNAPLAVFGNWSEGFKLPSFFALGNTLVGNPDLVPERSEGWEVGLRARHFGGRLRSRIAYFDIQVTNLIDLDTAGPPMLVNRDRVLSRGVEAEVEVRCSDRLRFGGSATWNDTDIVGVSEELPRRPRWSGALQAVGNPLDNVELGLRVLFVGDSVDFSIPTGDRTLDNYTKVDITASWQALERVKLLFVIENLFDADYEEAIGFPAVGIYPRVGAEIRF